MTYARSQIKHHVYDGIRSFKTDERALSGAELSLGHRSQAELTTL